MATRGLAKGQTTTGRGALTSAGPAAAAQGASADVASGFSGAAAKADTLSAHGSSTLPPLEDIGDIVSSKRSAVEPAPSAAAGSASPGSDPRGGGAALAAASAGESSSPAPSSAMPSQTRDTSPAAITAGGTPAYADTLSASLGQLTALVGQLVSQNSLAQQALINLGAQVAGMSGQLAGLESRLVAVESASIHASDEADDVGDARGSSGVGGESTLATGLVAGAVHDACPAGVSVGHAAPTPASSAVHAGHATDASRGAVDGTALPAASAASSPIATAGAYPAPPGVLQRRAADVPRTPFPRATAFLRAAAPPATAMAVAASPESIQSTGSFSGRHTLAASIQTAAAVSAIHAPTLTDPSSGSVAKWADIVEPLVARGAITSLSGYLSETALFSLRAKGYGLSSSHRPFDELSAAEQLLIIRQRLASKSPLADLHSITRTPSTSERELCEHGHQLIVSIWRWIKAHPDFPNAEQEALNYFRSLYSKQFCGMFANFSADVYINLMRHEGTPVDEAPAFSLDLAAMAFNQRQFSTWASTDRDVLWGLALSRKPPPAARGGAGDPTSEARSGSDAKAHSGHAGRGGKSGKSGFGGDRHPVAAGTPSPAPSPEKRGDAGHSGGASKRDGNRGGGGGGHRGGSRGDGRHAGAQSGGGGSSSNGKRGGGDSAPPARA